MAKSTEIKKVYIFPVPRSHRNSKAGGEDMPDGLQFQRRKVDPTTGRSIKTEDVTDKYPRVPNTIFSISAIPTYRLNGNLETGELLENRKNPYNDEVDYDASGIEYASKFERVLKNKSVAKYQHILEYKHEKPFNYYTNKCLDLTMIKPKKLAIMESKDEVPALMTSDYTMDLNTSGVTVLDLNNPKHEVMYHILKATKYVAESLEEVDFNNIFYVSEVKESEAKRKNESKTYDEALAALVKIDNSHSSKLIDFCMILLPYGRPSSLEKAYNELKNYINASRSNAKRFLEYFNLYMDKSTSAQFNARVMVEEGLEFGVFDKRGNKFRWIPPQDSEFRDSEYEFLSIRGKGSLIEFLTSEEYEEQASEVIQQIAQHKKFNR